MLFRSGEALCKLFTLDGSSDYERVISRIKRKRESLQARGPANRAPSSRLEILGERESGYDKEFSEMAESG